MITEQFEFIKKMQDNLINPDTSSSPAWLDIPVYGSVALPMIYGLEVKFYSGSDEKLKNEEALPSEYLPLLPFIKQVEGLGNERYTLRVRLNNESLDLVLIGYETENAETENDEIRLYSKNVNFKDTLEQDTLEYALLGFMQKAYETAIKDSNVARATLLAVNLDKNFYTH